MDDNPALPPKADVDLLVGQRCRTKRRAMNTLGVAVAAMASTMLLAGCGDDGQSSQRAADCGPKAITIGGSVASGGSRPTLPQNDATLAVAVSSSFCSEFTATFPDGTKETTSPPPLTPKEAACIGETLIDRLGAARVRSLVGLGLWPWDTLGFALTNQIDRAEAERIVDAFSSCSKSWKLLLITSVTEGADEITEQSARCTSDSLADDAARTVFVGEIDRAYDDRTQPNAQPFPELIQPLLAALERCLTTKELDALDWN